MTTVLPLYLERIDVERHMARFYAIHVERTLFGEWAVIYQWGRIGSRGRHQEDWLATMSEATAAVDRKLKQKTTRGYVVLSKRCGNQEIKHAV